MLSTSHSPFRSCSCLLGSRLHLPIPRAGRRLRWPWRGLRRSYALRSLRCPFWSEGSWKASWGRRSRPYSAVKVPGEKRSWGFFWPLIREVRADTGIQSIQGWFLYLGGVDCTHSPIPYPTQNSYFSLPFIAPPLYADRHPADLSRHTVPPLHPDPDKSRT